MIFINWFNFHHIKRRRTSNEAQGAYCPEPGTNTETCMQGLIQNKILSLTFIFKIDLSWPFCFLNCKLCINYAGQWSAVTLNRLKFPRYRTLHVQAAWIYMKIVLWLTSNFVLIYDIQGSCRIFVISIVAIAMIGTGFNSRNLICSIVLFMRSATHLEFSRSLIWNHIKYSCGIEKFQFQASDKIQRKNFRIDLSKICNRFMMKYRNIGWMIQLESENLKFWWTEKTEYSWLWFMIRHVMRIVQNYKKIWLRLGLFWPNWIGLRYACDRLLIRWL